MEARKTLLSIVLILVTYCFCYSQTLTPELKKALDRADAAKEIAKQSNAKEDWQDAIIEYKKAVDIDPTYAQSYYNIGYISEAIEDYDNAIKYYNKYLALDPKSAIAEEIQTKVNKLEYKRDKNKKQIVLSKSVNGIWKSDLVNPKTGRPYWIFTIDQFDNDMRVSISPKSQFYLTAFTFPTAIALKDKNKLHFMFTTDVSVNPKEALTASSNILNALDGVQSMVSSIPFASTAASIIGAVPAKAKNKKSTYIFSLDLSDTTKLFGKYNAKKYVTPQGETTKTISDSIKTVTFSKMNQYEYDALKTKKIYHHKVSGFGAFCLSLATPGGGQLLNKQYGKFIYLGILPVAAIFSTVMAPEDSGGNPPAITEILSAMGFLLHIYSAIEAPIASHKINKENGYASNKIYKNKNLCLKLNPSITSSLAYSGNHTIATGMGLSLCFK
ncbi:MAG: tetratricopeptide repeat protein [Bacteroidales bacterium]|jgi:tetratricopeptide (TPR) repeat protein